MDLEIYFVIIFNVEEPMVKKHKEPCTVDLSEAIIRGFQMDIEDPQSPSPVIPAPILDDEEDIEYIILDDDEPLPIVTEFGGEQQLPVDVDSQVLNVPNINNMSYFYNVFNVRTPDLDNSNTTPFLVGGSLQNNSNVNINLEVDLCGSHRIVKADVGDLKTKNIELPKDFVDKVNQQLGSMGTSKVQFGITTEWKRDEQYKMATFSNSAKPLTEEFVENGIQSLNNKIESMTQLGSNWKLVRIIEIFFVLTKISNICRLSGNNYIDTPTSLKSKKAVINVKNDDDNCFLYSLLALVKGPELGRNLNRMSKYENLKNFFKYDGIQMPMKLKDIQKFEKQNEGIAVNVLMYNDIKFVNKFSGDDNAGLKHPFIDIIHRTKVTNVEPYNLILLEKDSKFHYVAVKNIQRLLNLYNYDISYTRIQSHWCNICLNGFYSSETLEKHKTLCSKNMLATTLYTLPKNKYLSFKDFGKTVTPPFVIYGDFESILPSHTQHHQIHKPIAAGFFLFNNYTGENSYFEFVGEDCILNFLKQIDIVIDETILPFYRDSMNTAMKPMTNVNNMAWNDSRECYLCRKKTKLLVRDHCHYSGEYLGAACNKCNLSRQIRKELPVVFHNLKGYDMHHILKYGLSHMKDWTLSCIPNTVEKFSSLFVHTKTVRVRFIDSYAFLNTSLAVAVKNLPNIPITRTLMGDNNITKSKGIFPYDFATSLEVLETTTSLPPIWEDIKPEEYAEAQRCWTDSGCRTLLDYMLVYLKLDVLLLADVFLQFRQKSITYNKLEPLNFFGVPGLSWASALMTLEKPLELLMDMSMYDFFDAGIRGGMTFVNKHHVKASEDVQIMYIDINNLYGWAMTQYLPKGGFRWVYDDEELSEILTVLNSNIDISQWQFGCYVEVDIDIPESVHDLLNEMPVAPEKLCPPDSNVQKLLMTLGSKKNYPVHWRTLQFYIQLGAVVTKIHRAVKFEQGPVFKKYIDKNTYYRSMSNSDQDKDFFKLLNNSLYGKTVENLRKRLNLRLCNNATKLMTYTSKASFRKSIKIDEDLISVLLNKENICLNRPSYIGQAILDLSKLCMYELKYKILAKYEARFNCKISIVAGDTDSFFLECRNIDVKSKLIPAMIVDGHLDTSNYERTNPLYSDNIASVVGRFKDETKGRGTILEGVFLCPKSYSILTDSYVDKEKNVKKAKGVILKGSCIDHDSYLQAYNDSTVLNIPQTKIGSKNHQLFTLKNNKKALSCFDNKRRWLDKNISVAYGHYLDKD